MMLFNYLCWITRRQTIHFSGSHVRTQVVDPWIPMTSHDSNATPVPACHPNRRDTLPDSDSDLRRKLRSSNGCWKAWWRGNLIFSGLKTRVFARKWLRHLQLFNLHLGSTFGSYLPFVTWQSYVETKQGSRTFERLKGKMPSPSLKGNTSHYPLVI